ncbi:hypothetical protein K502DRAFT_364928 [Neoconidiobolus thromboides FSU 785]|nr:hypothetical protein K502DRAFT_364928 [Neoconidiobolus thromboides FSU 785]
MNQKEELSNIKNELDEEIKKIVDGDIDTTEFNNLKNVLITTQNNFAKGYQALTSNLQKTSEITFTMSKILETFLLSSLSIESKIETDNNKDIPILTIKFNNTGALPIPNVLFSLSFETYEKVNNENTTISIQKINNNVKEKLSTCYDLETMNENYLTIINKDIIFSPLVLHPNRIYSESWSILSPYFLRLKVILTAKFISPHDGTYLIKQHGFSVYLIDQLKKQVFISENQINIDDFINEKETMNYEINNNEYQFNPRILRNFFKISPTNGIISFKTWFLLQEKDSFLIAITLKDNSEVFDENQKVLTFNCYTVIYNNNNSLTHEKNNQNINMVYEEMIQLFSNKR